MIKYYIIQCEDKEDKKKVLKSVELSEREIRFMCASSNAYGDIDIERKLYSVIPKRKINGEEVKQ